MHAAAQVVEHLDPEPLSKVGACLLGGLGPKVLIMTTPNWEYNAVMRLADARTREALGLGASPVWPGPPGRDGQPLRCSDHRCACVWRGGGATRLRQRLPRPREEGALPPTLLRAAQV